MPRLFIDIEARLAKVQDALARVERDVSKSTKSMSAAFAGLNKVAGALGITLGATMVYQLGRFVTQSLDAVAALDDMAEATGATVEGLSRIANVAKVANTPIETVQRSMLELNKILEGVADNEKAIEALKALGLSLDDLRKMSADQRLEAVARAFQKFTDSPQKSAAALAIFKRAAGETLPFLKDLAEDTQIVGTYTAEQAAEAEKLAKQWRVFNIEMERFGNILARVVLPPLIQLMELLTVKEGAWKRFFLVSGSEADAPVAAIEKIQAKLKSLRADRDAIANSLSSKLTGGLLVADDLFLIDSQIAVLEAKLKALRSLVPPEAAAGVPTRDLKFRPGGDGKKKKDTDAGLGEDVDAAQAYERILKSLIDTYENVTIGSDQLSTSQRALAKLMLSPEWERMPEPWRAVVLEQFKLTVGAEQAAEATSKLMSQVERWRDAIDPLQRFREELDAIDEAERRGMVTADEAAEVRFQVNEEMDRAVGIGQRLNETLKETADVGHDLSLVLVSAAGEAIRNFEDLRGVLRGLVLDIQQMLLNKLVLKPLEKAFDRLFDSLSKSFDKWLKSLTDSLASVNWSGMFASVGKLFGFAEGGVMTSAGPLPLHRYAFGGVARTPQLALFGEGSKPEAFVPLPDGRRIPVALESRGIERQAVPSVVVNVTTPDVASFRSSQWQVANEMWRALERAGRYR